MEEISNQLWRGKYTTIKKDEFGNDCHSLDGEKAILFAPFSAEKNSIYRFRIEVRSVSGNGRAYFNIYASKEYDFSHIPLDCTSGSPFWQIFEIDVTTSKLPLGMPCMFRVWRSPHGTGSLLIRRILFEKLPHGSKMRPEPLAVSEQLPARIPDKYFEPHIPDKPTYTQIKKQRQKPHTRNIIGPPSVSFPFSSFDKEPTRVLVVSEKDETKLCNAFTANGILCDNKILSNFEELPSIVQNLKYNWIHIHINKETRLTSNILQNTRNIAYPVITIFVEKDNFNSSLVEVLQKADVLLVENELELAIYRSAGCFNAELWDMGVFQIERSKCDNIILFTKDNKSELAQICTKTYPQLLVSNDICLLSQASFVIIDEPQPSQILFSLLAARIPVLVKKSQSIAEWCQENIDLRFFDTLENCVKLIGKMLENPSFAQETVDAGEKTSKLHSINMRVSELAKRVGCSEIINSKLSKDRMYDFQRIMCVTQNISLPKNIDSNFEFLSVSFTTCRDIIIKITRFNPDVLCIFLNTEIDDLPWYDLLLDIRRRLPNMLVLIIHDGNYIDERILNLRFSADHIFINNENIIEEYKKLSIMNVDIWKPALVNNLENFYKNLKVLIESMSDRRSTFLSMGQNLVDLTVFIGTYNRLNQLKEAVRTSLISAGKHTTEIIINDAGSTDGTQEWLRRSSIANIIPIFSGKRTSFTQAFNESLQIAKGKYICWLSDDIVPEGLALSEMCSIMDQASPSDMGGFSVRNSWGYGYNVRMDSNYYFPTVGCMYTETLRKMNGINMDYPYYSQDTDLDMRIYRLGGHIIAATNCRLAHNCANDELRKNNGERHRDTMGDAKFLLAVWNLKKTSSYPYPAVLLIPSGECLPDHILKAAARVRSKYSNSHMFVVGEKSTNLNIIGSNSFLRKITFNCQNSPLFDLIIEVWPDKNILIKPADKAGSPFVKNMLE